MKKTCSKCKQEKVIEEFNICMKSADCLNYWCKDCCRDNQRINSQRKKDRIKARFNNNLVK